MYKFRWINLIVCSLLIFWGDYYGGLSIHVYDGSQEDWWFTLYSKDTYADSEDES